jgi:NADH-quinone oxidoreductase subunit N
VSTEITLNYWLAIAPEIALLILLFGILGYKSVNKSADGRRLGLITAWGTFVTLLLTIGVALYAWGDIASFNTMSVGGRMLQLPISYWGGMIVMDPVGVVFRVMFLAALLLTVMMSLDSAELAQAEYFALLIAATIGFNLMVVSSDLIMLVVALETASISLYLLAGYVTKDRRSPEAGLKYFIYGAFASAVMLYGMSLLYGITGTANIYRISQQLAGIQSGLAAGDMVRFSGFLVVAAVLLITGFAFKIAAVPFHWWAPDVYEGAPTPVTGFLSTASKAAGFGIFIRLFAAGVVGWQGQANANVWWPILVAICVITMTLGNLLAIYQTNIKRMLAYSSVAQAGYVLIGLVALTQDGAGAALFYLFLYVLTNIAAFGVVVLVSNKTGSDEMHDFYGLSRRSPGLALVLMLAILSLGGIPPTAGFIGKFFLFKAAVEAGMWPLAAVGIFLAFVSLYYYLTVIKYIYLYRNEENDETPIPVSRAASLALGVSILGVVFLGVFFRPALEWMMNAARWFFPL